MAKMLESGQFADVTFAIGQTQFQAHRVVIAARAPILAELAEDVPSDGQSVQIDGVDPVVFQMFLRFVYADEPPRDLKLRARELVDVANRFGCSRLKIIAESELVQSKITVDTAADLILFADAQSCALLKETAIDFFAANASAVMLSTGWSKVKESAAILAELMEVAVGLKGSTLIIEKTNDIDRMRVATLRRKLDEKGLDVDGSREILVKRLKKE